MADAEEIMMNAIESMSFAVTIFSLSTRLKGVSSITFPISIDDDSVPEFLAIPALNNPRAGFARCKENNHV